MDGLKIRISILYQNGFVGKDEMKIKSWMIGKLKRIEREENVG